MKLKTLVLAVGSFTALTALAPASNASPAPNAAAVDLSWKIRKDHWSVEDEAGFERFVRGIGESNCRSIETCMKSPANPYRESDPAGMRYYTDCADLPYFLRTYYAWKNNLPFSYVNNVFSVGATHDIRYSKEGNRPATRLDIVATSSRFPNGVQELNKTGLVSSAMFRYHPDTNDAVKFTDHYPVKISKESIKPGTVLYDPNGHVAVVWKVEVNGTVRLMDGHPDNSLTRPMFGEKFGRSRPGMGAGFKRWRPLKLVGYTKDAQGNLIGGKFTALRNENLSDYSKEQFFGMIPDPAGQWNKGTFVIEGQLLKFHDYVRARLGTLKYNPVERMAELMSGLCNDIQDRVVAVQLAMDRGIAKKAHPSQLPKNIYGTSGEWEDYSSPSRDARLKTSFHELYDMVSEARTFFEQGNPRIVFPGSSAALRKQLLQTFNQEGRACQMSYVKSDGVTQELSLIDVMERSYQLSFDPYHCVELRWGATHPKELAACRDEKSKLEWYAAEQFMRNNLDRPYDARMDFNLRQAFVWTPNNGVQQAPEVDVRKLLQ